MREGIPYLLSCGYRRTKYIMNDHWSLLSVGDCSSYMCNRLESVLRKEELCLEKEGFTKEAKEQRYPFYTYLTLFLWLMMEKNALCWTCGDCLEKAPCNHSADNQAMVVAPPTQKLSGESLPVLPQWKGCVPRWVLPWWWWFLRRKKNSRGRIRGIEYKENFAGYSQWFWNDVII